MLIKEKRTRSFLIKSYNTVLCPGGGIGRHKGLKSLEGNFVPVQVRSGTPILESYFL